MTPLQQKSLIVAKRYVGTKEATGRNDGPIVRMFQRFVANGAKWLDRQPWCTCFATFCIHTAAKELGVQPQVPKNASSSSLYRWFRDHGKLLKYPQDGCVGLVRGGPTGHSHTFLVAHVEADGVLRCIEGNLTNSVRWHDRHANDALDYGLIC